MIFSLLLSKFIANVKFLRECRRAIGNNNYRHVKMRFNHFTVNDKLPFAVNSFTLPVVCPYLGLKIRGWYFAAAMFVFICPLTSILAENLSPKLRFLKYNSMAHKQKSSKKSHFFSNVGL